jgi:hypothetical protein
MAWKKNSPEAVQRFDKFVAVPGARRSVMFGCPIYVLRGQRYASLHQNRVVLRLSPRSVKVIGGVEGPDGGPPEGGPSPSGKGRASRQPPG